MAREPRTPTCILADSSIVGKGRPRSANHPVAMLVLLVRFDRSVLTTIVLCSFFAIACQAVVGQFLASKSALIVQGLLGLMLMAVCFVAALMQILGNYDVRSIASAILCTGFAGLAVLICQWLVPTAVESLSRSVRDAV